MMVATRINPEDLVAEVRRYVISVDQVNNSVVISAPSAIPGLAAPVVLRNVPNLVAAILIGEAQEAKDDRSVE